MSKLYLDPGYAFANGTPSVQDIAPVLSVELSRSDPSYIETRTTGAIHRVRLAIFVKVEV